MLDKYFDGVSDSTAERRLYPRPDFPKPLAAFPGMNIRDESAEEDFAEKLIAEGDIMEGAARMMPDILFREFREPGRT